MTIKNNLQLTSRLFQIVSGKKGYKTHPSIILPDTLSKLDRSVLITNPDSPAVLELGAGSGEFAVEWIQLHPRDNYVAFEIKGHRIKSLLRQIDKKNLNSIKIIPVNFKWFLTEILPPGIFDTVIINFPDPWPKKRHWKHRLIDPEFPIKLKELLKPGGLLHMATDYGPYARKVLRIFRECSYFSPVYEYPHYQRERPENFPGTRFEAIHEGDGKKSYYQQWRLNNGN